MKFNLEEIERDINAAKDEIFNGVVSHSSAVEEHDRLINVYLSAEEFNKRWCELNELCSKLELERYID
jgi:hypothetical protein